MVGRVSDKTPSPAAMPYGSEMWITDEEWAEDREQMTNAGALSLLEYGSCDGCGRANYCPVCGGHRPSEHEQAGTRENGLTIGHRDGCPVPALVAATRCKPV